MNLQTSPLSGARLSQRLKTETAQQHERMHELMEQGNPFADRGSYARFVAAQYLFQRDVEHLFQDAAVKAAVPDLEARGRQEASLADLADLGAELPQGALGSEAVGMPEALGWLYVSEGSTLGAAFLFKEARDRLGLSETFGARNLAAYPQGRALAWRAFVTSLDAPELGDAAIQDKVIAGANAAYDRFGSLLERYFPQPAAIDA
ncbi:MAG: biliverdin-producing heme oxygenase [Comamonas testosteroni]|uniref:biliverdin-producing heme oxygenase n=1 Tax=Comamonas testosteroni TaxID=285 RepID=UPI003D110133